MGFNPSGGGIGSGPGGSSSANASLTDTVFATLVGLGIGKSNFFLSTFILTICFSFRWWGCVSPVVQVECIE